MSTKATTKATKKTATRTVVVKPGKPGPTLTIVVKTPAPAPAKPAVTPPPPPVIPVTPPPPPPTQAKSGLGRNIAIAAIVAILAIMALVLANRKHQTVTPTVTKTAVVEASQMASPPICDKSQVSAKAVCDKQTEIINQLKKQLADTKKVMELEKAQAPVAPAPQVPLSARVKGAGTAFSFASGEAGITDVNVHISKSGDPSVQTQQRSVADKAADEEKQQQLKDQIESSQSRIQEYERFKRSVQHNQSVSDTTDSDVKADRRAQVLDLQKNITMEEANIAKIKAQLR